jgi:CheY-like chemotaxis protein
MKKILAVATEQRLLDVLGQNLSAHDCVMFPLTEPDNLTEAINIFHPDLLIIDFILHDINGGAICHQLKCDPITHNLPVILLSEYAGLERFAQKFGSDAMVQKDAMFPVLMDEIEHVLHAVA